MKQQSKAAVLLHMVRLVKPLTGYMILAVIMGTEGDGLSDNTIADCDYTVKIPMYHGVDSLNVAAASAVAFYQLAGNAECKA